MHALLLIKFTLNLAAFFKNILDLLPFADVIRRDVQLIQDHQGFTG
jgi:hypothetical protein